MRAIFLPRSSSRSLVLQYCKTRGNYLARPLSVLGMGAEAFSVHKYLIFALRSILNRIGFRLSPRG